MELDPSAESTSEQRGPQPVADTDEHDVPSTREQRKRTGKAPERFECDDDLRIKATGQRWSARSCCPGHMPVDADSEPSTSEFTGPMDKYLSDTRVEAAVNRAVKSITDNPADLERELRAFKFLRRPIWVEC